MKVKNQNKFKRCIWRFEIGDIDVPQIARKLQFIHKKQAICSLNGLRNADEFVLSFKFASESIIGPGIMPGKNKVKCSITFLACANAEWSEKLNFLLLENLWRLIASKGNLPVIVVLTTLGVQRFGWIWLSFKNECYVLTYTFLEEKLGKSHYC